MTIDHFVGPKAIAYLALISLGHLAILFLLRKARKYYEDRGDSPMAAPIFKLVRMVAWCASILMSLGAIGVNTSPVYTAIAGAIFGLSTGLRGVVNDIASAFIIWTTDKAPIGQTIIVGGVRGKVIKRDLFTVILENSEMDTWTIPNGEFRGNKIGYAGGKNDL